MGEVSEPGLACLDILGDLDGLGDGEVGGVGFLAKSVDNQNGDLTDKIADGAGNGSTIGQVGDTGLTMVIHPEAGCGDGAMRNGKWGKGQRADGEGTGDGMRLGANVGGASLPDVEGVVERFFEPGKGEWIGVDRDAVSIFHGVRSEIIEAGNVVGMAVGVQDGIEPGDAGPEGLGAEIGRGVDDDAEGWVLDPNGGAEATVAWIGGGTDATGACEEGDALGCSGAQKGQTHRF